MAQDEPTDDNQKKHMEEWTSAREVIAKFDDRLHDLRKYGFTFVAALLTADSILVPTQISIGTEKVYLPNDIKFAVLLVSLSLLIILKIFDITYSDFLKAAVTRANIIEKELNLELTETISFVYRYKTIMKNLPSILYYGFQISVLVIAYFVFGTQLYLP